MKAKLAGTLTALLFATAFSHAKDGKQEVARELGAILAWRLGPETVEQHCRSVDPGGVEARKAAVKAWLDKNSALIEAVDARVAEVVPLAYSPPPNVNAVEAVRAQVRAILLEPMISGATPEQMTQICKAEAKPSNPRLANSGLRAVQQSLAALYDWKVGQGEKKP